MMMQQLQGTLVRLEPLEERHIDGLVKAAQGDRTLYEWSFVPHGVDAVRAYFETALAAREAGAAVPFATVRVADDTVIGSTRLFDIERWAWPADHERYGAPVDGCEIGYTWLTNSAIRTGASAPGHETRVRARQWNASARGLKAFFARTVWPSIISRVIPHAILSWHQNGRL